MPTFRVVPIPDDVAAEVRRTLKAPGYGHPAHVEVAAGYGPCRACLRTFREGAEERVLFTWDAFAGVDGYPSPGPVFIHRDACEMWSGDGFPPELRPLPLMLEGYGAGRCSSPASPSATAAWRTRPTASSATPPSPTCTSATPRRGATSPASSAPEPKSGDRVGAHRRLTCWRGIDPSVCVP